MKSISIPVWFLGILLNYEAKSTAALVEISMSMSAVAGTSVQFHCAGDGTVLIWEVDGLSHNQNAIVNRGIDAVIVVYAGTVKSNLTVPATSENNGTTVRCAISLSLFSIPVVSNYSTLTVLPGIGKVTNLAFDPIFSAILWNPPLTAGVQSNLSYHLIVVNINNGLVIINTTTNDTRYPIGSLEYCTNYKASVIAFTSKYSGNGIVVVMDRTPGGYFEVLNVSKSVSVNTLGVFLKLQIHVHLTGLSCPNQKLRICIQSLSNASDTTNHELSIQESGNIIYHINSIKNKLVYTISVSVFGNEGVVQVVSQNVSTFDIQGCDVRNENISILVECTFAINSTAPGFVVVQNEEGNTINKMLQRLESSAKGSANFTDLSTGEYSVQVFDQMEDSNPAYVHHELFQVDSPINFNDFTPIVLISTTATLSGSIVIATPSSTGTRKSSGVHSPSPDQSPTYPVVNNYFVITVSSVSAAGLLLFLILLGIIILICSAIIVRRKRQKKERDVSEDISVDENPAYITLQTINMNKNCAYETVTIPEKRF